MPHQIRKFRSDAIYMLTRRCIDARFFLRPSKVVNKIILDVLAYTAHKHQVEIFGFVFMSNHYHLLVRALHLNISAFMRDLNRELAKKLNAHWGRSDSLFGGRFTPTELLDDPKVLDKLCYVVCNPCESNLVRHPKLWPGLSSWELHNGGEPMVGERFNGKKYDRLKREHPDAKRAKLVEMATERYELKMAKLPMWEHLDDETYNKKACGHIKAYAKELCRHRKVPCLGAKKVLEQHFNDRPARPKKSPKPLCLAADPRLKQEFLDAYRDVTDRYREAAGRLRRGHANVEFPHGTFPPGHACCVGSSKPKARLVRTG